MLEIGTSEEVRGIVLDPPEANGGTGFATNGTINTTFLDLVYKRLDSGNSATDAWDQGGNGITNIGNSMFIGSVDFRVGTTWYNLFTEPVFHIDSSNSYTSFLVGQPLQWGQDPSNPDMVYDNQTGQFAWLERTDFNNSVVVNAGNLTVGNRVNLTQSGAIRATSITTSGSGTFAGGVTAGTSIMPSGAVSIGSAVTLFQNLFLSGVISDGSNPVSIANIAKLTANQQVFNGTTNFSRVINAQNVTPLTNMTGTVGTGQVRFGQGWFGNVTAQNLITGDLYTSNGIFLNEPSNDTICWNNRTGSPLECIGQQNTTFHRIVRFNQGFITDGLISTRGLNGSGFNDMQFTTDNSSFSYIFYNSSAQPAVIINATGNGTITIPSFAGGTSAYVCVTSAGVLFRSESPCVIF